jgi:hypothetical protein
MVKLEKVLCLPGQRPTHLANCLDLLDEEIISGKLKDFHFIRRGVVKQSHPLLVLGLRVVRLQHRALTIIKKEKL